MYYLTIKISLILLLLVGCSPEKSTKNDDISTLIDVKGLDESILENERLETITLRENDLNSIIKLQEKEIEASLIEEADKLKSHEEEQLLKAEIAQRLVDEQILLNSAKSRELALPL